MAHSSAVQSSRNAEMCAASILFSGPRRLPFLVPTGPGLIACLCAAVLLSGCAATRVIDSIVQSHSAFESTARVAGQSYQFERLPLVHANAAGQANLERWTADELARYGLVAGAAGTTPRFTVQLSAGVTRHDTLPWTGAGPGWPFGVGLGVGGYPGFRGWGASPFVGAGFDNYLPPTPRYRREFEIVLRDAASHAVVFQSRAFNDSGWWDDNAVLPALVQAALQGFPNPPAASRNVRVPLGNDD